MSKTVLKTISIILGFISIYWTINLIPDKTNRNLTAFSKQYTFEKELEISEKFTTDFESSYEINFRLDTPRPYKNIDSTKPIEMDLNILRKNKPVKIFENNSFLSESGQEYELKVKLINANSKSNTFKINIQTNVPRPTYDLLIEREFKWVFWIINTVIMLIALICGYFGFKKTSIK